MHMLRGIAHTELYQFNHGSRGINQANRSQWIQWSPMFTVDRKPTRNTAKLLANLVAF